MLGEKISQEEMQQMFGSRMPIEAVSLLYNAPDGMTVGELRDELRRIAKSQKSRG